MSSTRQKLAEGCGRAIFGLVLAMLVFAPLAFGAVDEWAFLVVQGLAAAVFLLWIARLWLDRRPRIIWPPLAWAVVAFAVYGLARYATADIEWVARGEVIQVVVFALVFLAVLTHASRPRDALVISLVLIGLGTLIAGGAVGQLLTHSDRVWNVYSNYHGRAGGTYISPNDLAGLLGMLLPLTLALLIAGRLGWVTRILLAYALLVMLAGLSATFSRAGWVATGAGLFFVLAVLLGHRHHRLPALITLLVLLAGGGVFVTKYLAKTAAFRERVNSPDYSGLGVLDFDTRFALWHAADAMWRDHFWFGVGPGLFDYRFPAYRPALIQERPNRVHNDYLNLLADWGTVGGGLVLAGMGLFAAGWWRAWPRVRTPEVDLGGRPSNRFAFFAGASGGLASLAVHSAADFNLHIPANALVGVTLLALLAGQERHARPGGRWRVRPPARVALTLALAVVTVALAVDGWRRGRETWWLAQAQAQGVFTPGRPAGLEKAFAAEPEDFQVAYDLGESLRLRSFQGGDDYATLARQAADWYGRCVRLNPYFGYGYLRLGMCQDWLGQTKDSQHYYDQAEPMDPNGYFMVANIGWHFVQTGDYAMAREYFIRSMRLSTASPFAQNYLSICEDKLADKASGKPQLPF